MGRCGWRMGVTLVLALLGMSCGGSSGGPSDSGDPFVFQIRGRMVVTPILTTEDPTVLTLLASLFDPLGNPLVNQRITFEAEFNDATFIPQDRDPLTCDAFLCSNRGASLTNANGQVSITLIAGFTTGSMRIIVEAPPSLNIATGLTVQITNQGFVSLGPLGIVPSAVTFINPLVRPGEDGPMSLFHAVGGTPPYKWKNQNIDLGRIDPIGLPNINEKSEYTLIGPIPTETTAALVDTVTVLDADASEANASVLVVFADCEITTSVSTINISNAVGGEEATFLIPDGVPPFSATQTFPEAGSIDIDDDAGLVTFTVATPPFPVAPNTILMRDARGCTATVEVTVVVATLEVDPDSLLFCSTAGGEQARISIVSGVPPFTVTHTFDAAGGLICEEDDGEAGMPEDTVVCEGTSIIYEVEVGAESVFDPDTVTIVDAVGNSVTVPVVINGTGCPDVNLCGNGMIDDLEPCDTFDLDGETCASLGFTGGVLTCNDNCTFNTSQCTP